MNISKRILALVLACFFGYALWRTFGLPDMVYHEFSIGRGSSLADKFVGFLSIIAMIALGFSFIIAAIVCFAYATSSAAEQKRMFAKSQKVAFEFMLTKRIAGVALFFAGLFVWFLAYLIPEFVVERTYWWRPGYGLRDMVGMLSVACMFAGAALGFVITAGGGALALVPHRVKR